MYFADREAAERCAAELASLDFLCGVDHRPPLSAEERTRRVLGQGCRRASWPLSRVCRMRHHAPVTGSDPVPDLPRVDPRHRHIVPLEADVQ
jgi:hypothetical protein